MTNALLADEGYVHKVDAIGDPLQKIEAVVDFAALAQAVEKIAPRPEQPKGGRPPYPTEVMVRILVVKSPGCWRNCESNSPNRVHDTPTTTRWLNPRMLLWYAKIWAMHISRNSSQHRSTHSVPPSLTPTQLPPSLLLSGDGHGR